MDALMRVEHAVAMSQVHSLQHMQLQGKSDVRVGLLSFLRS